MDLTCVCAYECTYQGRTVATSVPVNRPPLRRCRTHALSSRVFAESCTPACFVYITEITGQEQANACETLALCKRTAYGLAWQARYLLALAELACVGKLNVL